MEYTVKRANEYIISAKRKVNPTFRPKCHFAPPVGWMNDPNGLIKFGEIYHLFYQFYPYEPKPGPMHWGHFVSDDLIAYRDAGVALAPNAQFEDGCFSGGAEILRGKLGLLYTRHHDDTGSNDRSETLCAAISDDGETFIKTEAPVFDNETLPENISRSDFRDPYPIRIGDRYYVFLGGKDVAENKGIIVVLSGRNLNSLEYDFTIGPFAELGEMAECPCYCKVDGKDVICVSGVHEKAQTRGCQNRCIGYFIVGDLDFDGKNFCVESIAEIDRGDAFYAPQFVRYADRPTIVAWLENWDKRYPTQELKHGWAGAFSVPRELSLRDGKVCQVPVRSLEMYRRELPTAENVVPRSCDIAARTCGKFGLTLFSRDGSVTIGSDDGRIFLDTNSSNNLNGRIMHTENRYDSADIRILVDVSSIELFVADGEETISSRMYLNGDFGLETVGGVSDLKVYEITVGN